MKHRYLPVVFCGLVTWALTSVAEPAAVAKNAAPKAPKTVGSTVGSTAPSAAKLPKILLGTTPLDAVGKLALAKELTSRLKIAIPKGLEQSVKLSARHLYEEGRADLSLACGTSVDPVGDFLIPQIYKVPVAGPALPSAFSQLPKPPCEVDRSQVTKIRVMPSKPGQAILFDITVESEPSLLGTGQSSTLEAISSAAPGSRQSWEIGPGEAGHLTGIMMPPGLSWLTLELHLLTGGVKIRAVELTPLQ